MPLSRFTTHGGQCELGSFALSYKDIHAKIATCVFRLLRRAFTGCQTRPATFRDNPERSALSAKRLSESPALKQILKKTDSRPI